MKIRALIGCFAITLAVAQEKSTNLQQPVSYSPTEVKVLGDLDYGRTSPSVIYSNRPQYRAFVFSGFGNETFDITVNGTGGRAFVALADSSLTEIASGTTHLTVSLPYRGPDMEVWYVVFRDTAKNPGRFTVRVNKLATTAKAPPKIENAAIHAGN